MALKTYKLSTPNVYLLIDDSNNSFKIVAKDGVSDTILPNQAAAFVDYIDGHEVADIVAKIKRGEELDELARTATYGFTSEYYNDTNFMAIAITINGVSMVNWTAIVLRDEGIIELPAGAINDIYLYLTAGRIKPGGWYVIESVEELPDPCTRTDIAYLLTKADGTKPAGTAWRWNGSKWLALSEGQSDDPDPVPPPPPEPDPMDPTTYPDSEVKEDEPQSMGDATTSVVEVVDGNITQATTVRGTDLAFVVNCTMGDGVMNITVTE